MKKNVCKFGVLGTGLRATGICELLLKCGNKVSLRAVFDPDKARAKELIEKCGLDQGKVKICNKYEEITSDPELDWTMVVSPNYLHKDHIIASFENGKNVFAEKPLATTVEDCQAIYNAHKKSRKMFATGFVLRYAPLYVKAKEILDSGILGKIISIDANENIAPDHGTYIMRNWRRLTKFSGPHILEKCCHDIDLLNWFIGSIPSQIASFGGRNFFIPSNKHLVDKYKDTFTSWVDPHSEKCPFTSEKDIMDNQVAIMEYRNKVRVMFQATMSNSIPERRMYFSCTEGTLITEFYSSKLKFRRVGCEEPLQTLTFTGAELHGGGDSRIMQSLYDSMTKGSEPQCSGNEGLESSVVALSIDKAREKNTILNMEPIWEKLGKGISS